MSDKEVAGEYHLHLFFSFFRFLARMLWLEADGARLSSPQPCHASAIRCHPLRLRLSPQWLPPWRRHPLAVWCSPFFAELPAPLDQTHSAGRGCQASTAGEIAEGPPRPADSCESRARQRSPVPRLW